MTQKNIKLIKEKNGISGKMYNEKYVKNNYNGIYNDIINFCNNELNDLPFKEKVYHYVNGEKYKKTCKNPNCNNLVKYKNSRLGYYDYCSKKCISSDPSIKKIKEENSLKKFGTKAPAMNDSVKKKIISTNLKKYKHNSPLLNNEILNKSKKTLMNNYGVDNPSKNKDILNKRTKTYSDNIKNKYLVLLKDKGITSIDYKNKIMIFKCTECKFEFTLPLDLYHNRKTTNTILCTHCNPIDRHISGQEIELQNFISNNYKGEIIFNSRNIINPYELDVYLPDLNLAFEFNGLYYHNELNVEKKYHLNKTEKCEKKGIQLIHIYEDDWLYKQEIVKSIILNKLGKSDRIYARKTEVKEVNDNKLIKDFLEKNHIQGFIGSKIKLGLFYENELISLMTFGKRRVVMGKKKTNDNEYELLRFCNKLNTNIIGGASKLFKYFINNYEPKEITTYADRFYSQGKLYEKLGLNFQSKTQPNYYYVINKLRKHRFNFRKDILVKNGFDPNKTEHEIMLERKIYRIYDSGNLKFVWNN